MISPTVNRRWIFYYSFFIMKSLFLKQDFRIRLRLGDRMNSNDSPCKNGGFSGFSVISSCKTTKNRLLPVDFQIFLS